MPKKPNLSADADELRRRAEGQLKRQRRKTAPPRTDADTQRLVHELQVHQVELEMQNAELLEARDQMEAMLEKYTDLYDFAPVGYFSIDEQGVISEVNLTGAALLGVERSRLIGRRLQHFLSPTSRPVFLAFLEKIFAEPGKQVCEASLLNKSGTPSWVDFQATPAGSGSEQKWCRLAVSDITALKRAEEAQRRMEALDAANRELKREIVRRKAVEAALKKSERYANRLLAQALGLQKQLQHLSHRILRTQEDERKRISRELHDDIAQVLTAISFHLAVLRKEGASDGKDLQRKIVRTQRLVEKSVNIVHEFASQLRPPALDDLGLIPALHSYVNDFGKRMGLSVQLTGFTRGRTELLDSDKRTVLYRVVQEALINVAKHAKASEVTVSIRKLRGAICIEVHDDGKSFDVREMLSNRRRKALGLLGMRERVEMVGGCFAVKSSPGKGTTIRAEIPVGNGTKV
ncbi:sensor histidine kinase [Anaerobaca lacustris]|uniref:histidine kinase n=1 Tax=Anaerobaca lacustris TaxID=3044600 RepID=A0AAW6U0R5_9BACT|nr:histidine kinase [Sedimentisphaerales bacterium M17dextr]